MGFPWMGYHGCLWEIIGISWVCQVGSIDFITKTYQQVYPQAKMSLLGPAICWACIKIRFFSVDMESAAKLGAQKTLPKQWLILHCL